MPSTDLKTILLIIMASISVVLVIFSTIRTLMNILAIKKNNKMVNSKMKQVEEMKANGEFHEWINMTIGLKNVHVCKKTGFCPSMNGFVPMDQVKLHLMKLEEEKEYEVFKGEKLKIIANKYNIKDIDNLYDEIFSIKKDFCISKMDKFIKEIKERKEI